MATESEHEIVSRYVETVIGMKAVAVLNGEYDGPVSGTITIVEPYDGGPTTITGKVVNLKPPGKHGFHIHEFGDHTNGCVSAGGHYNPYERAHGGPQDACRHAGDLGNIIAGDDGIATVDIASDQIMLSGEHSVMGRSIVVHADEDDLGKGDHPDSLTTGHAGIRLTCGVIGNAGEAKAMVAVPEHAWFDKPSTESLASTESSME